MANTTLIFGRKKPGQIGNIVLDATISEQHNYDNEITAFPIENGTEISDHIITKPDRLIMNGFITNSPVNFLGVAANIINGKGSFRSRTVTAFDELLELQQGKLDFKTKRYQRELITIVTGLKVYTDMAMVSIVFPRDSKSGDALSFTAQFQKLKKVDLQTVAVPKVKPIVKNKAIPKQAAGSKTGKTGKTAVENKNISKLKQFTNWVMK